MNRNALLLRMKAGSKVNPTSATTISRNPELNDNGKFNPDVKAKFSENNGERKKQIKPSDFKLPEVIIDEKSKNLQVDKLEKEREKQASSLNPPKPKRKINFTPNINIETPTQQKESTNEFYQKEKEKLENEKHNMENILKRYQK